jgi:hypothetical protein
MLWYGREIADNDPVSLHVTLIHECSALPTFVPHTNFQYVSEAVEMILDRRRKGTCTVHTML